MRLFTCLLLLCAVTLLLGCAGTNGSVERTTTADRVTGDGTSLPAAPKPGLAKMVKDALVGRVVMVNSTARFAVLSFPLGQMAAIGQHLAVYRAGVQVGELKASGPQRDDKIVADILAGDCQIGDEVWDK
jgi:hypothetical protein